MEDRALKISRKKTEYLRFNEHQDAGIHLQRESEREREGGGRETVKRVKTFTYLGSTLAEYGELDGEVTTEGRAGGRTGRQCLECCATGE